MVVNTRKTSSRRRKWTLQLAVIEAEKKDITPPSHPLSRVNECGREESRLHTLGEVLAAVAGRQKGIEVDNKKSKTNQA